MECQGLYNIKYGGVFTWEDFKNKITCSLDLGAQTEKDYYLPLHIINLIFSCVIMKLQFRVVATLRYAPAKFANFITNLLKLLT